MIMMKWMGDTLWILKLLSPVILVTREVDPAQQLVRLQEIGIMILQVVTKVRNHHVISTHRIISCSRI